MDGYIELSMKYCENLKDEAVIAKTEDGKEFCLSNAGCEGGCGRSSAPDAY